MKINYLKKYCDEALIKAAGRYAVINVNTKKMIYTGSYGACNEYLDDYIAEMQG